MRQRGVGLKDQAPRLVATAKVPLISFSAFLRLFLTKIRQNPHVVILLRTVLGAGSSLKAEVARYWYLDYEPSILVEIIWYHREKKVNLAIGSLQDVSTYINSWPNP